jgi:DNA-binding transcriptional LysR family regulator
MRSDYNATLQGLVTAGLGYAVLPLLSVDLSSPGIQVFGVEELPPRRIGIAWRSDRHRSLASQRFVDSAVRVCETMAAPASI